jgi:hypothetical protein
MEERLYAVEQDVAVIRSNYVTREDLQKAMLEMTWRIIGFVLVSSSMLTGAVYHIARNVH